MQPDENRSAQFTAPIRGTLRQRRIQLLFWEIGKIGLCRFSNSRFCCQQVCHRRDSPFRASRRKLCSANHAPIPPHTSGRTQVASQLKDVRILKSICDGLIRTVAIWRIKRFIRSCIAACSSMIPALLKMNSIFPTFRFLSCSTAKVNGVRTGLI